MAATGTKKRVPYFCTEATVDVEIDPDDLHDAGWHHQNECPLTPVPAPAEDAPVINGMRTPPLMTLIEAVESLHRQAHPSQHRSPTMCHEEPCRSLTMSQLRGWGA
jgi:hypothetical protein